MNTITVGVSAHGVADSQSDPVLSRNFIAVGLTTPDAMAVDPKTEDARSHACCG